MFVAQLEFTSFSFQKEAVVKHVLIQRERRQMDKNHPADRFVPD